MGTTLVPPLFPRQSPQVDSGTIGRVRPFGLTTAVAARAEAAQDLTVGLALCPDRQVAVTDDGTPFIHEPSMKSAFSTTAQTTEDMQLDEETENDTD